MKNIFVLLLFYSFSIDHVIFSQAKDIALEDIWEKGTFASKRIQGFDFIKDGLHFTRQLGNSIIKYEIGSGKEKDVIFNAAIDADKILIDKLESYTMSPDENKILFETNSKAIYRYSSVGIYYVYDRQSKKLRKIFDGNLIQYPKFNPQSNKLAFVFENNLYYEDLELNKVVRITKDGERNKIINGASDWVYEEEFVLTRSYEWSPSGDQIVFIKFDESDVKEFYIEYFRNEMYPEPYKFKYPKVDEKNAILSLWNFKLKSKKLKQILLPEVDLTDSYLPRIQWTKSNEQICITWINRLQNNLKLLIHDTNKNTNRVLLEENNKYYIDIHDNLIFLDNGKQFLWTSEMDGFNNIYLYDLTGKKLAQLTKGDKEVTEFYGLDVSQKYFFYQRSEDDGLNKKIYIGQIGTNFNRCLTPSQGTHSAIASPGIKYLILTSSTIASPPVYKIINEKGEEVRMLEDNAALKEKLKSYNISNFEFLKIANRVGDSLNAVWLKPNNFDPKKKYPVFMHLYGGPGSQKVSNRWNSIGDQFWFQMLAQKDYIICVIDNRGTGGRGEEFKKMTYMQLGKLETEDQIDGAKYLATLPFVDGSRIGIFGWSYGGYMSSLCLLKGNDVFKSAIAVAPVTNWKWYDSIYTERFMKRRTENQSGYDDNSPINFADRLKGNYLLVHGMADDNVHFQHAAEMANALIKNKKQFDSYFYPNRNHSIFGENARMHLFQKMTNFVLEKI